MDTTTYLTPTLADSTSNTVDPLHSRLIRLIQEIKQERAGPAQWTGIINGLSQKGVKAAEIADCGVINFLAMKAPDEKVEKSQLLGAIARQLPRIKCVDLQHPKYANYRNVTVGSYNERLYILSSEAMQADDEIDDLLYRLEDLGFNPAPLIKDPTLIDRLEAEMKSLRGRRPEMYDFTAHHFSSAVEKHGKNLMAHARTSRANGVFFVEEIQSDWAQQGRRYDWTSNYPKAPLVAVTEQWSGVVLRDLLNTAAKDPRCTRFAWINSTMRNGFNVSEDRDEGDDLQLFYATIVRKMAEKCISKAGGRIAPMEIDTKNGTKTVLGFEMTPAVREALIQSQPMYSRESVLPRSVLLDDPERQAERASVVRECSAMLGTAHTIRFAAHVYDVALGVEVPGKYLNRGLELSMRAKDMSRTARHESWHFAQENFLLPHENRKLRLEFDHASDLNHRTRDTLLEMGERAAAAQCIDPSECAAHAFSLWCEGKLEVTKEPQNIFEAGLKALNAIADWLEKKVFGVDVKSPEELFTAMRSGALAIRQKHIDTGGLPANVTQNPTCWTGPWSRSNCGSYETQALVTRHGNTYTPGLMVSRQGGDAEPTYGTPVNSKDEAIQHANDLANTWHQEDSAEWNRQALAPQG